MRNQFWAVVACVAVSVAAAPANVTLHDLSGGSLSQDWSNTNLIVANDDWSGVPSIMGYRGDDPVAGNAVDPQTVLADYSAVIDVNANQTNPDTFTTGGVAEFDTLANPVVALQGSGTADFTNLVIYVKTTGVTGVSISYALRDIDGSTDNAVEPVALQYRLGNSGNFTNVPGAFVADASTGPSEATLVTLVSASDPAWDNQAEVQFRIITSNAAGSDEWIGVDDIVVSAIPEPATMSLLAVGGLALLRRCNRR